MLLNYHNNQDPPPSKSDKFQFLSLRVLPGRVDYQKAGYLLDYEPVAIRALVSLGLLKPLGNNHGTEHKYFSTKAILRCAEDEKWLDTAAKALQTYWHQKNSRRKTEALNPSRIKREVERPKARKLAPVT